MKLGDLQRKRTADDETENELATQTKERPTADDSIFNRQFYAPSAETQNKSMAAKQDDAQKLGQSMANVDSSQMPSINADSLNALANADDEATTDATVNPEPEPPEPNTLPAIRNEPGAMYAKGEQRPNWLTVDQLPGYMQRGIKAMGKVVFNTLTSTPLGEINLMVNLQNGGPNEAIEMNAVGNHARKGTSDVRDLAMTFGEMIPGYEPQVKMYIHDQETYLLVRDDMGDYIYSWPSKDNQDTYTPMAKIEADNKKQLK